MKSRTTMTYAVALAAASTLALAGCNGGGDEPTASSTPTSSTSESTGPTSSASPTSSATPTPSASVSIPAAAKANTEAGAVAFLKFYFDQVNKAYTEPNDGLLPELADAACKSCAQIQQGAEELVTANQRMKADVVFPLTSVETSKDAPAGETWLAFTLSQPTVPVIDQSGKELAGQKASSVAKIASLVRGGDGWKIHGIANQ